MPRDELRLGFGSRKRQTRSFDPRPDSFLDRRDAARHQRAHEDEKARLAESRRRAEEADAHADAVEERRQQDAFERALRTHPSRGQR